MPKKGEFPECPSQAPAIFNEGRRQMGFYEPNSVGASVWEPCQQCGREPSHLKEGEMLCQRCIKYEREGRIGYLAR